MNLFRPTMYYGKRLRIVFSLMLCLLCLPSAQAADEGLRVHHLGNGHSLVRVQPVSNYLLLPVQEDAPPTKVSMTIANQEVKSLDVRLARERVDYFVPVALQEAAGKAVVFQMAAPQQAVCWEKMQLSDQFDTSNRERWRPAYHFTPAYGWMNDPNGMVYKEGEYHLFYQHNPYGSMWGNMHWGHAVSRDLAHWEHLPIALAPDALGAIFSGSCVVDAENTAGFGKGAIVAFYTSAGARQTQSLAYSTDNGRTFQKYEGNPVISSDQPDFRDPKVMWHNASKRWIMVLAVGQELQFYSSQNLKDWSYESSFGEGQGAHAGVWECPDLFELPVEGTNEKKWVLICNINPGGPFGGSATQYFVGTFDGKRFVNESPSLTKWMDYGKDHYATVTWSNAPKNRVIALAWMSNWEYANNVPTLQYRSANSVPRDLSLFKRNGETFLSSKPSPELLALRGKAEKKGTFKVNPANELTSILANNTGSYELEIKLRSEGAKVMDIILCNAKGEEVVMRYNLPEQRFLMDRRQSGQVDFSKTFATATEAPLSPAKEYTLRLYVDKSSIEAFDGKGEFAMTNLVFPAEPYNRIRFEAKQGGYTVTSLTVYAL